MFDEFHSMLEDEEGLKRLVQNNIEVLEKYEPMILLAKELAEDNDLLRLDKTERLHYVKAIVKLKKDKEIDAHHIAAMLQTVYNVNMNMFPMPAIELLLTMFLTQESIKAGYIEEEEGGLKPKGGIDYEDLYTLEELENIDKFLGKAFQEMFPSSELDTQEQIDAYFEKVQFIPKGHTYTPSREEREVVEMVSSILRDAYIQKFGSIEPYR